MKDEVREYLPASTPDGWDEVPLDIPPFSAFNLGAVFIHRKYGLTLIVSKAHHNGADYLKVSLSSTSFGTNPIPDDVADAVMELFFPTRKLSSVVVTEEARREGRDLARSHIGDAVDHIVASPVRHFIAKV
jgi:hypothetical protein